MTDFIKAKIGFALALLAALFAIYPIIHDLGKIGFMFLGHSLEIRIFYYSFAFLLSLAVYLYAIEFIRDKPVLIAQRVGNIIYAIALLVPPFYGLLWITSWFAKIVAFIFKSPKAGSTAGFLLGMISSVLSALLFNFFRRKLNLKDKKARVNRLSIEEVSHIDRANAMFKEGHYDLTVFEAFRAIESALQKAVVNWQIPVRNLNFRELVNAALKAELIPQEIKSAINEIRILRNKAAHEAEPISKTSAQYVLKQTRKTLGIILRKVETIDENGGENKDI